MKVVGLKLEDVIRQLESEGYLVDEPHQDSDGDDVVDVYSDEDSQRILEMTFDKDSKECIGYAFMQSGFANHDVGNITETLEVLW